MSHLTNLYCLSWAVEVFPLQLCWMSYICISLNEIAGLTLRPKREREKGQRNFGWWRRGCRDEIRMAKGNEVKEEAKETSMKGGGRQREERETCLVRNIMFFQRITTSTHMHAWFTLPVPDHFFFPSLFSSYSVHPPLPHTLLLFFLSLLSPHFLSLPLLDPTRDKFACEWVCMCCTFLKKVYAVVYFLHPLLSFFLCACLCYLNGEVSSQ